jgi:hypothetical protein
VELGGNIECPICDWDWELESDDDRPHLCHQCGYDSKLGDFDEEALNQWEKENQVPFQEQKEERYIVRTFSESTDDMELVWHRDREDTYHRVIKGMGDLKVRINKLL